MKVAALIIGIFGSVAGFIGAIVALFIGGIGSAFGRGRRWASNRLGLWRTDCVHCRTGGRCSGNGETSCFGNLNGHIRDCRVDFRIICICAWDHTATQLPLCSPKAWDGIKVRHE